MDLILHPTRMLLNEVVATYFDIYESNYLRNTCHVGKEKRENS